MAIETKVDEWITQGNDYFDSGKYDKAVKCYDKVITKYSRSKKTVPDYTGALFNKGLALHNLEKYSEAIKCYDKVIEKEPNDVGSWNSKGVSLNGMRKYNEAIECFRKAIEIDPNYSLAWLNQGISFLNLEKNNEAIKCYDIAIEKDPNNKSAWYFKGFVLYILGKYNEAIECYNKAIEKEPNDVDSWNQKGYALIKIGNYSEAESCYNEVIKIDPKNIDALQGLLQIYSDYEDEYNKALQTALTLLEIQPDSDAKANMAEILIKVGRYEEGRKYAMLALNEMQDFSDKCIARLFIISSYVLENNEVDNRKEYAKFFEFYMNLNKDFKVEEESWNLKGLTKVIGKSNTDLQTKFLLLTLFDLIQGKIDKQKLSFFGEVGSM